MLSKKNSQKIHACIMDQIKDVEKCLISFESFMRAATTPETVSETLSSLAVDIGRMEAEADASLRRMIDSLSGAYLPSTREDIISIATSCDKVANKCESVTNMMVMQKFSFPAGYAEDVMKILSVTHEQFEILEKSISALFGDFGSLLKDHSILDQIREKESWVDEIEKKLYEQTFAMEDMDLAHKMQVAQFVEHIADISDAIENIADKIQIMLITRKA